MAFNLQKECDKILEEFRDDVDKNMNEAIKKVTKAGAKQVKANARSAVGGKKYASGWTSQFESGRLSAQGTKYNRSQPGMPHLLEYGHVTRNGTGRTYKPTPEHPHIESVEQELEQTIIKELKATL